MTVLDVDLTAETDASLDRNLRTLYALHRDADDAGRAEVHEAIMEIVDEFGRRSGEWIERKDAR